MSRKMLEKYPGRAELSGILEAVGIYLVAHGCVAPINDVLPCIHGPNL
jgi:hypothetical protein